MTIRKNKFQLAEDKGRKITEKLLKSKGMKDITFSEGAFDVCDVTFFDNQDKMWVGEIKCRDKKYSEYNDMLIEKAKLDNLNKLVEPFRDNVQVCYINVYEGVDKAKVASIRGLNLDYRSESHVKTTSGNNNLVSKLVGYIKSFKTINF